MFGWCDLESSHLTAWYYFVIEGRAKWCLKCRGMYIELVFLSN